MCVSIYVSARVCLCMCGEARECHCYLFFLNLGLMFSWLDWKPWTPGLFCDSWDSNSSPQDCTAGMLYSRTVFPMPIQVF